ncbi:MAG: late competence development ComFB family protein [Defluviitaleaceae bacterium]|nr:late competence development ComFB family protein [Defluviitaleaceae bacterium]
MNGKFVPVMKNYMEDIVDDLMIPILKSMEACSCDRCSFDIKAITLNSLPAKYIVTKKGKFYTKLESLQNQFEVDTIAAIAKAAEIVARFPRHDDEGH